MRSADVVVDVQVGDACLICFDVESEKKNVDSVAPSVGSVLIPYAAPSGSRTWRRSLDSPGRHCRKRRIYISEKKRSMYVFYCLYSVVRVALRCFCANVVGEIYTRPLMQLSVVLSKNVSTGN